MKQKPEDHSIERSDSRFMLPDLAEIGKILFASVFLAALMRSMLHLLSIYLPTRYYILCGMVLLFLIAGSRSRLISKKEKSKRTKSRGDRKQLETSAFHPTKLRATEHPQIFLAEPLCFEEENFFIQLESLKEATLIESEEIHTILKEMIPSYQSKDPLLSETMEQER